jgi:hypothetical protein
VIALLLIAVAAVWLREESSAAELRRLRSEANRQFEREYQKAVVGYQRTVALHPSLGSERWSEWSAEAEVEFINKVGGVERTNLCFKFSVDSATSDNLRNHAVCVFDYRRVEKLEAEERARSQALDKAKRETQYESERAKANAAFWRAVGVTNEPPGGYPEVFK